MFSIQVSMGGFAEGKEVVPVEGGGAAPVVPVGTVPVPVEEDADVDEVVVTVVGLLEGVKVTVFFFSSAVFMGEEECSGIVVPVTGVVERPILPNNWHSVSMLGSAVF